MLLTGYRKMFAKLLSALLIILAIWVWPISASGGGMSGGDTSGASGGCYADSTGITCVDMAGVPVSGSSSQTGGLGGHDGRHGGDRGSRPAGTITIITGSGSNGIPYGGSYPGSPGYPYPGYISQGNPAFGPYGAPVTPAGPPQPGWSWEGDPIAIGKKTVFQQAAGAGVAVGFTAAKAGAAVAGASPLTAAVLGAAALEGIAAVSLYYTTDALWEWYQKWEAQSEANAAEERAQAQEARSMEKRRTVSGAGKEP